MKKYVLMEYNYRAVEFGEIQVTLLFFTFKIILVLIYIFYNNFYFVIMFKSSNKRFYK